VNEEITEGLKDQELLDGLQTPCSVFVMFETEEGVNRARELNEKAADLKDDSVPSSFASFLGGDIELQEASEPTDIIWENRFFAPSTRHWKRAVTWIVILVLLAFSACVIFLCQTTSIKLKSLYPKTDCEANNADYIGDSAIFTYEKWIEHSFGEYLQQKNLRETDQPTTYSEIYQCLCRYE
jgi:hypothetical protein